LIARIKVSHPRRDFDTNGLTIGSEPMALPVRKIMTAFAESLKNHGNALMAVISLTAWLLAIEPATGPGQADSPRDFSAADNWPQ